MTSRQLAKECRDAGWVRARQRGSHAVYTKEGAVRPIIFPVGKKDLPPFIVSTVRKLIRDNQ